MGDVDHAQDLRRYIDAVPLAAITAVGLGPMAWNDLGSTSGKRLWQLMSPTTDLALAIDTAGSTGRQILSVLTTFGGSVSESAMAREAGDADPDALNEAVERLMTAGLIRRHADGALIASPLLRDYYQVRVASMSDSQAITSDELAQMCKRLGIVGPTRKAERIAAIKELFCDPERGAQVLAEISAEARDLLHRIADISGPWITTAESVGLSSWFLRNARPPRYAFPTREAVPEIAVLRELTFLGIVGVHEYYDEIFIWSEAWSLLDRPLFRAWPVTKTPNLANCPDTPLRMPPLMALVEQALRHWDSSPPSVLKSNEDRLSKADVRSTARSLGTSVETIELISRLALGMRLLLRNTVHTSGRGRNRQVDQVWRIDSDLMKAWTATPLAQRWLRLFAEWSKPTSANNDQLLANRHLLLWELASIPDGRGWADHEAPVSWLGHRYGPVGVPQLFGEALSDLQILGIATADAPIGLTTLGRIALDDVQRVVDAEFGSASEAVVQADHSVIAPPDLDPAIAAKLTMVAELESDSGARVYRLSESLITSAVQSGETADTICAFLDELSSVPLVDTVRRLVQDAAARADKVIVMSATTVVVIEDPADLMTACSVKSAKLTKVAPNVAVSALSPAKVKAALERKGLAPVLLGAGDEAPAARRAAAHDPSTRLVTKGPLALTPSLLDSLLTTTTAK